MIGGHRQGMLTVDRVGDRRAWGILNSRAGARGLWIVPDLWNTHRTRLPQGRWKTAQHAVSHTLHRRTHSLHLMSRTNRPYHVPAYS
jgi:hypothetical protein